MAIPFMSVPGTVVITTPGAWWAGPNAFQWGANAGATISSSNGQVCVCKCVLPVAMNFGAVNVSLTAGAASANIFIGIYSADGNTKLIDSGAIVATSSGVKRGTFTSVVIPAGVYWVAWGTDLTGPTGTFTDTTAPATVNGATSLGTAANVISGGALPSTLGAISAAGKGKINIAFEVV